MSERIAVGDLVIVVRWCCGKGPFGKVFKVGHFDGPGWACLHCSTRFAAEQISSAELLMKDRNAAPVNYVKRIPPLEELGRETRKEEIEA